MDVREANEFMGEVWMKLKRNRHVSKLDQERTVKDDIIVPLRGCNHTSFLEKSWKHDRGR
jgi:hypothetical protein